MQGLKAWYWRYRDQEAWWVQDCGPPKDQEMAEKAKHHSTYPVSIPDLKEGASSAPAMPPSPSLSGPQSCRAQA